MKTSTIRQTVSFPAPPGRVYQVLMTSRLHEAFTGAPARISAKIGGSIMAWGGYIHGRNVELIPGKRIVQSWVPSEENWPPGHESTVKFEFSAVGKGTRLRFTHSQVPADHAGHLTKGWYESYWNPLKKYLRGNPG
ncbi:MAG TPA: SRPBCC family protein [Thermoplasmata archaeon]|nr:SRPBCC family protein [Thermoplasmata archaeon]